MLVRLFRVRHTRLRGLPAVDAHGLGEDLPRHLLHLRLRELLIREQLREGVVHDVLDLRVCPGGEKLASGRLVPKLRGEVERGAAAHTRWGIG